MDEAVAGFFAKEAGLLIVGIVFGALWFRTVALLLLYAVPRSAWWALQGRLRWRAVPLYLVSPLLWAALLGAAAYLLAEFAPAVLEMVFSSTSFYLGQWVGISVIAYRALALKSGRRSLQDKFLDFVRSHLKRADRTEEEERGEDIYQRIWHFSRVGKRYGPFTYVELHQRAARGELHDDDLLWRPGIANWVEASSVFGLTQDGAAARPPR